ncbi:hypothetical protein [Pantoea stewartii]|uniref:Prophage protein n=1 Tax=Pantoea stewartii subsp. stewartii DC283 TaxID=660596 RepID=A0ABM6K0D6_PANSE|nr:hypothetical protein [Pantoea stewartii]ARF48187.1 hypothetical protein DSJ_01500 [Pantoea stewartii subsp. stewartii DC283]ARF49648.1 hypothetical protein DSJ_10055 [Pantoea stewartii subsp. stewartii DC283]KAB0545309.1 hypothetical protein F7Q90_25380 [Pantoea stewartii subsp. stewartii]
MSHEITLQQATERADQANVTLFMLRKTIDDMDFADIGTAVSMASDLLDSVAAWLLEEQAQRNSGSQNTSDRGV